jgi:hypothetical protein
MAIAILEGRLTVASPRLLQVARLCNVPPAKIRLALRERNSKRTNGQSNGHAETLAEHITRSSPAERAAAARIVGPAALWDTMIIPVISEERAVAP